MTERHRDSHYEPELLEQAFSHLPAALLSSMVISPTLVVVLWRVTNHASLLLWLVSLWILCALRFVLFYSFRRRSTDDTDLRRWRRFFNVGVVLAGITWGISGPLFFSQQFPRYNVFVAFFLGGITAGAANSLAPLPQAMRLFTVLELSPAIVRFLATGDDIHVAMGAMLFLYGAAYIVISAQTHRTLLTSLGLRRQNVAEIAERQAAENELRRHKEELEELVRQRTEQLQSTNEELSAEVAEHRATEERLRVSEERFRDLVETTSDWIWEVDANGVYTYASPKIQALLGYQPEEVIHRTAFDLMPAEEADRVRRLFQQIASSGRPFSGLENKNLHKDGRVVIIETSGEPIKDASGKLLGYRGVDRDITERKRIESESLRIRNLESLGLLAGGIAHDFNNLLSAILGNIDLARYETAPDSGPSRLLEVAANAIDKARRLTSQLLTFSRGGSPVKKPISMANLIIDTCHFVLSGSSVKCNFVVADDLWDVECDEGQIWQVLQNLLINAADAMPRGGTVTVSAQNCLAEQAPDLPEEHGAYVKITVADNGDGIPEELLSRVFDPYFSTKPKSSEKGSGLGLTICHSIIKKHDGHIFLESRPGKGTTASFFLPATAQRTAQTTHADTRPARPMEHGRILLLEDEELVRNVTVRLINQLGYECEFAMDGETAIEHYRQAHENGRPFDLVILDLTIRGGMGGEEVMRRLLELDPEVKGIVASGYADSEVIAQYQRYGFLGAIVKPYTLHDLQVVIEQFI